ncbi:jeltraxin-like [Dendropsophus ebraccatus]|uniref:jeltraxin-like n=1 Tax=Dendropsophus ebraccatus TaxID=150705 RepID=UPI003831FC3C
MRNLSILVVLFCGCFALKGKKIIFPKQTATDHVILKPTVKEPLKQLTVCLRSYTDLTREHSLLSIATTGSGKDNTFLIYPIPPTSCSVFINGEEVSFRVKDEGLNWKYTCVAWDSETGLVILSINNKQYPIKGVKKGSPIGPEMSVILGQEQDTYGGGFQTGQSFVGEIYDVIMWDHVVFTSGYYSNPGNIFNWINGSYVIRGDTVTLNNLSEY